VSTAKTKVLPARALAEGVFPEEGRLALIPLRDASTEAYISEAVWTSTTLLPALPSTEELSFLSESINFAALRVRGFIMTVQTSGVRANVGAWMTSAIAGGSLQMVYSPQLLLVPPPTWGAVLLNGQNLRELGDGWGMLNMPGLRQTPEVDRTGEIRATVNVRQFAPVTPLTEVGQSASVAEVKAKVSLQAVVDIIYDEAVEFIAVGQMLEEITEIPGTPTERLARLYELAVKGQRAEMAAAEKRSKTKARKRK